MSRRKKQKPKSKSKAKAVAKPAPKWTPESLKAAGLPVPLAFQTPQAKRLALKAEQDKWYDKLAKDGFEDIEWTDNRTGKGHNAPLGRHWPRTGKRSMFEWYRLCAAYREHNTSWPRVGDKLIWDAYTEGASYRAVLKRFNSSRKRANDRKSLFYIFKRLHWHIARLRSWHETAKAGLWNESVADVVAYDVPIRDYPIQSLSAN